jgi:hypothetical protein
MRPAIERGSAAMAALLGADADVENPSPAPTSP